ncbi:hypothetical protein CHINAEXTREME_20540 (plasmid) [Halobiforma lacisalsi AJ5]|uniref:Uncharacterized protein n=1 Tax=Natronobacterium lacisalsi AJ5 TaxID=358396 RepID=M0LV78_NATLA|nr:hypothetical protein [Halobiforma lacisalsi]APX00202.1 hypothetical protein CHINAEXTREME_20540 [Halobiforma lacisalsi AJ5]EMA37381.1 hypothetical protein C445_00791 [Halobiforma lacisalsi AJ5]
MQRRTFLATAATPSFFGPFGGSDGRQDDLERDDAGNPAPPDHIEVRDDREELLEFQPQLSYDHLPWDEAREAKSDVRGMYGWTAESTEHDVIAHYYWVRSNTQRSVLWYLGWDIDFKDAHFTDHEPIIVFRQPDKTIEEVWCSGGHHYGLRIDGDASNFVEDRVAGEQTHVVLAVARPHNHFFTPALSADGEYVQDFAEYGSWLETRETWYDNGRYSSTSYEAVENPFVFYDGDREHWWREDTRDAWLARNVWIPLGLSQGTDRDELAYE